MVWQERPLTQSPELGETSGKPARISVGQDASVPQPATTASRGAAAARRPTTRRTGRGPVGLRPVVCQERPLTQSPELGEARGQPARISVGQDAGVPQPATTASGKRSCRSRAPRHASHRAWPHRASARGLPRAAAHPEPGARRSEGKARSHLCWPGRQRPAACDHRFRPEELPQPGAPPRFAPGVAPSGFGPWSAKSGRSPRAQSSAKRGDSPLASLLARTPASRSLRPPLQARGAAAARRPATLRTGRGPIGLRPVVCQERPLTQRPELGEASGKPARISVGQDARVPPPATTDQAQGAAAASRLATRRTGRGRIGLRPSDPPAPVLLLVL